MLHVNTVAGCYITYKLARLLCLLQVMWQYSDKPGQYSI